MMAEQRKACVFCRHFFFDPATPPWSDVTPGEEAETGCRLYMRGLDKENVRRKGWWLTGSWTEKDWIRSMAKAETCEDYEYIPLEDIV